VSRVPLGDSQYHVIYLFYIDDDHEYEQRTLATYSPEAKEQVERITALDTVSDVESYVAEQDALDAEDLRDLLR